MEKELVLDIFVLEYVQETNNRKSKISKIKPTKYINKNGSIVELKDTADLSSAT